VLFISLYWQITTVCHNDDDDDGDDVLYWAVGLWTQWSGETRWKVDAVGCRRSPRRCSSESAAWCRSSRRRRLRRHGHLPSAPSPQWSAPTSTPHLTYLHSTTHRYAQSQVTCTVCLIVPSLSANDKKTVEAAKLKTVSCIANPAIRPPDSTTVSFLSFFLFDTRIRDGFTPSGAPNQKKCGGPYYMNTPTAFTRHAQ